MNRRDGSALCRQANFGCNTLEWAHGWIVTFGNHKLPAFQDPKVNTAHRYGHNMDHVVNSAYAGGSSWMWVDREYYPDSTLDMKERYELLPWSNPARREEFDRKANELMVDAGYPDGVDLPHPYYTTGVGRQGFKGCYGSFLDQYSRHMDDLWRAGFKTFLECRDGVDHLEATKSGRWSIMSHSQPIVYLDPGTGIIQTGLKTSGLIAGIPWDWPGREESDAAYRVIQKTLDPSQLNELYKDYERMMANPELILFPNFYSRVLLSYRDCVHNYRPGGVWFTHLFALERVWLSGDCRE
jgi:ABC-type transport system substrate-binding protein